MFEMSEVSYGINHMTFLAGPRVYLGKSFFTGVGAGYLLFFVDGFSEGSFAFSPHIGFDRPKTQWTLNYTATTRGTNKWIYFNCSGFQIWNKKNAQIKGLPEHF